MAKNLWKVSSANKLKKSPNIFTDKNKVRVDNDNKRFTTMIKLYKNNLIKSSFTNRKNNKEELGQNKNSCSLLYKNFPITTIEEPSTIITLKKLTKCSCNSFQNNSCFTCRRHRNRTTNFSRPKSWSKTAQVLLMIWTILMAPLLTDILRKSLLCNVKDRNGNVIYKYTSYSSPFASACNPPGAGRVGRPVLNLKTPLVIGQKVPNVSERTIGASGPAEGRIFRQSERFQSKLKVNWNMNVVFKNEEMDHEDRLMTQRCKDSLDQLAILVSNQWQGVKVRVTEAWKEEKEVVDDDYATLHYEGRAIDITTDDVDRAKYGLLARLAVSAGFDWVYYKSEHYVHCSCKSDSLDEALYEGCFPGNALVQTPDGASVLMSEIKPGDKVLSVDDEGNVVPDTVLTFMDRKTGSNNLQSGFDIDSDDDNDKNIFGGEYYRIKMEDGRDVRMTANHLIFVSNEVEHPFINFTDQTEDLKLTPPTSVFAKRVKVGQYAYVLSHNKNLQRSKVISITRQPAFYGAYAPLTSRGTLMVDGTLTSCYAVIENHSIAHAIMLPVRYFHIVKNWFKMWSNIYSTSLYSGYINNTIGEINIHRIGSGVSLYSKFWYKVGSIILPSSLFQGF